MQWALPSVQVLEAFSAKSFSLLIRRNAERRRGLLHYRGVLSSLVSRSSPLCGVTFLSALVAITGILVSCFDKHPGPAKAIKLSAPHQSSRDIESLRHQFQSETGDVPPRVHISRPRALSTASRSQGPYQAGGPAQPAPAYTLPRQPRRNRDPSSSRPFDRDESGGRTLVLNRQVTRAVGQAPRNQATFMRIDDTRTPPVRRKESKADERDMWKRKYLV